MRRAAPAVGAEAVVEPGAASVGAHIDDSEPIMTTRRPARPPVLAADEVTELLRSPVSTIYDLALPDACPIFKMGGPCD